MGGLGVEKERGGLTLSGCSVSEAGEASRLTTSMATPASGAATSTATRTATAHCQQHHHHHDDDGHDRTGEGLCEQAGRGGGTQGVQVLKSQSGEPPAPGLAT